MRKQTGFRNPAIWFFVGVIVCGFSCPVLFIGLFFGWELEAPLMSVRFYDTNLTNPDLNSPNNLTLDLRDENEPNLYWIEDESKPASIGYLHRGQYYVLRFEPSKLKLEREIAEYYKHSEVGTENVGIISPPWLSVNVTQSGKVLSPFTVTETRITPIPKGAKFLRKVQ